MNTKAIKIELYDTTLRDGSQGEGISYTVQDKLRIARKLDDLGIHLIEGGWPGSNPKDMAFFEAIKKEKLKHAQIAAFGSTRRAKTKSEQDPNLRALIDAETPVVTIFGKTWDFHVKEALKTTLAENLHMISDSVEFLHKKKRRVIYDAEHFFDGYKANPDYAIQTILAAEKAGAETIVLCDTNGGTMPSDVFHIVSEVRRHIMGPIGIHTHNDAGVAVANAISAVEAGATQIQGTINGIGERCGNQDLIVILANLQLKLGYSCLKPNKLSQLTDASRYIAEVGNMILQTNQPYVGKSAFAHKGGIHINAVLKNPQTYEHIKPEEVGNRRRFLSSELSGKSNIVNKARDLQFNLTKNSPKIKVIHQLVQKLESDGFEFEAAEASFELLILETMRKLKSKFELLSFRVLDEKTFYGHESNSEIFTKATVRLKVKNREVESTVGGIGPVAALDQALKSGLLEFYPQLKNMHLSDFKVRVIDQKSGTEAKVRVFIESQDEDGVWTTVGISRNLIEASCNALIDSIKYKLIKRK